METIKLPAPSGILSSQLQGTWLLQKREDWTEKGERVIDPTLGENPLGILAYATTHFSAQFMKRDRGEATTMASYSGTNNTTAIGGYDAYFGTYEVNEATGRVLHTLEGSINKDNVGLRVWRDLRVVNDELIIQLATTTIDGEPITRRLTWKRDH